MNDKREPAFARRLLRRRWSGATLHRVAVIFGGAWSLPQGGKIAAATVSEFVAISSRRWEPETTDWRCLTDLRVVLVDQDDGMARIDGWPLCVWVASEVADCAAVVHIATPRSLYEEPEPLVDIQRLAWDLIEMGESPSWWPAQRALIHDQRRERFIRSEAIRAGWEFAVSGASHVRAGLR